MGFPIYPQVEIFLFFKTSIPQHIGPRDDRVMGSKIFQRGSLEIMINHTLPPPTHWFPEPHIHMLRTQHHRVVTDLEWALNPWVGLILPVCRLWADTSAVPSKGLSLQYQTSSIWLTWCGIAPVDPEVMCSMPHLLFLKGNHSSWCDVMWNKYSTNPCLWYCLSGTCIT